jgi:hypothetical protein
VQRPGSDQRGAFVNEYNDHHDADYDHYKELTAVQICS